MMGKNRFGEEIKHAKFHAGMSVIVTFPKVADLNETKIRGYIRSIKGQFLDSPEFARFRYEVVLDKKYCSSDLLTVGEEMIREG